MKLNDRCGRNRMRVKKKKEISECRMFEFMVSEEGSVQGHPGSKLEGRED